MTMINSHQSLCISHLLIQSNKLVPLKANLDTFCELTPITIIF